MWFGLGVKHEYGKGITDSGQRGYRTGSRSTTDHQTELDTFLDILLSSDLHLGVSALRANDGVRGSVQIDGRLVLVLGLTAAMLDEDIILKERGGILLRETPRSPTGRRRLHRCD